MSEGNSKTSTGIQQDSAGLLCYLGWWITGIIFWILEKENKVVRFHAVQSIITFGLLFIALIVLGPIFRLIHLGYLTIIIAIFSFILWIVMMVVTAQGKMTKLPWAGNLAEKYANTGSSQTGQAAQPQSQAGTQAPEQQKEERKD
jgi:uncharacterized membrane protein